VGILLIAVVEKLWAERKIQVRKGSNQTKFNVIIHTHLKNTVLIQKSIALKVAHPPKHRSAKREGERDKVPVE
jgi:hypothetical protein